MLYNIVFISAIHQHESAIGICMSPLHWTSLPPPIPSSLCRLLHVTEPWFEFLESHSKLLAIYFAYGSVYVSLLLSPFFLPSLHPKHHALYLCVFKYKVRYQRPGSILIEASRQEHILGAASYSITNGCITGGASQGKDKQEGGRYKLAPMTGSYNKSQHMFQSRRVFL